MLGIWDFEAGQIMTTVLNKPTERAPVVGEDRILLSDISWEFYVRFCEEIGERPIRLSYSEGMLEIMVTHSPHEFYKTMLAKLIEMIILEHNIPVRSGGSMTFQREDLEKGFEPDECWWIEHEASVRRKKKFDFQRDPPPDLAIEIEISRSLVNRAGIFAAMGVKELWRHNGKRLRFCVLQGDGTYQDQKTSLVFPFLRPTDLEPYLGITDNIDETTRVRRFRDRLRARTA
jgi:Uma2 family endonuclease